MGQMGLKDVEAHLMINLGRGTPSSSTATIIERWQD
jgi:hypothetical protein